MRNRWWIAGLFVAVALHVVPAAADLRPSWECLPADTAVMVRLPQPARFLEAVKTRTKFGSVALVPKRLEGLWRLVAGAEAAGDRSLEDLEESLAKYGLEGGDLATACSGDLGTGFVIRRREGQPPLPMLLGWLEPGEEVAGRIMAAIRRRLEEEADRDGPAPRRLDLELAGHEVLAVVAPVMGLDVDDSDLMDPPGELDEAELEARIERLRAAKPVQTGERHALACVIGGRMLFGITLPVAAGPKGREIEARGEDEEARRMFATYLEAHAGADEPALAAVLREPALVAAEPAGVPLVELVAVPQVLLASVRNMDAAAARGWLAEAGLDDVGGIAWRQTFDEGRWRSVLAATLPAPRHGLLEILDQRSDAPEVPTFVTREVADFTQISLDLGAAFGVVRRMILARPDAEQAANMLAVADVQAQTWLGSDVATLLSGLGSRHWLLSFPPQMAEAIARARAAERNGEQVTAMADRFAMVWQIADEEPYLKLLGRLAPLAGGELQEEQGFRGIRVPGGAAAYLGRGHLVLAVGEGTLEKVLAAIRTPPTGAASLRESGVPGRVGDILPPRPARLFGVSDSTRTGGTLGMLRDLAAALEPGDMADDSKAWLAAVKALLPGAAEMEGMFGVGGTLLRITDDGLVYETAWEMPPP